MDLRAALLRLTPPRPLLVAVPGADLTRVAVERAVRERGWRPALSPAEANLLVVAGPAGADLEPYVAQVWGLVPAPKVRVDVAGVAEVAARFDEALLVLRDPERQVVAAGSGGGHGVADHSGHEGHGDPGGHHWTGRDGADDESGNREAGGHDETGHGAAGGHDESGHGAARHGAVNEHGGVGHGAVNEHGEAGGHTHGHDMASMDLPGGLPMAERGEDRDGLKLDRLHVPLGPVLPFWPAGLIVRTVLQGDVIQEASVEVLDGSGPPLGHPLALRLDSAARLLALAGWHDAAVDAQRYRDLLLDGEKPSIDTWARRVTRSRTLRWSLAGIGVVEDGPPARVGDAWDRLSRWLRGEGDGVPLEQLPELLVGTELAAARLVVASLVVPRG